MVVGCGYGLWVALPAIFLQLLLEPVEFKFMSHCFGYSTFLLNILCDKVWACPMQLINIHKAINQFCIRFRSHPLVVELVYACVKMAGNTDTIEFEPDWPTLFVPSPTPNQNPYYGYCKDMEDCDELVTLFSYETSTHYVFTRGTRNFGHFSLSGRQT